MLRRYTIYRAYFSWDEPGYRHYPRRPNKAGTFTASSRPHALLSIAGRMKAAHCLHPPYPQLRRRTRPLRSSVVDPGVFHALKSDLGVEARGNVGVAQDDFRAFAARQDFADERLSHTQTLHIRLHREVAHVAIHHAV